jgi:hypothetical protein
LKDFGGSKRGRIREGGFNLRLTASIRLNRI